MSMAPLGSQAWASSPLTRGKPGDVDAREAHRGLIPAHAGKTTPARSPSPATRAHPRSRGENCAICSGEYPRMGSSPLTRGKHEAKVWTVLQVGLIPAHAGKTPMARLSPPCSRAHPRSRGENAPIVSVLPFSQGSSPLTRGKRPRGAGDRSLRRLIPAHAGKTGHRQPDRGPRAAHPRSRGKNRGFHLVRFPESGSSPLTRGKRLFYVSRCGV